MSIKYKRYSLIPLTFLFIVAIAGSVLRLSVFTPIGLNYQNLLHAHSHVAFQGWVFLAIYLLFTYTFIPQTPKLIKQYKVLFWVFVATVIGILISFTHSGYALYSIIFSSIFQICNYWYAYRFYKDIKAKPSYNKKCASIRFARFSIVFMLISTLGPWAVAVIMASGLKETEWYPSAIYFFLHFQYNGFFTLACLSLLFNYLEQYPKLYRPKMANAFFWLTLVSIVPTYFISLLGMSFRNYIAVWAYAGAAIGLLSLYPLYKILKAYIFLLVKQERKSIWLLCCIVMGSYLLKLCCQFLTFFPSLQSFGISNHYIIIGYLHAVLIGSISLFLIAYFCMQAWWLSRYRLQEIGLITLCLTYILTESLLLFMGFQPTRWGLQWLLAGSFGMALGIALLVINAILTTKPTTLAKT